AVGPRDREQALRRHRLAGNADVAEALVHERAGRTRDQALAARYAARFAHAPAVVEGDDGGVALAPAPDHEVVLDVAAPAHAAVADDARGVVDGDVRMRDVGGRPAGEGQGLHARRRVAAGPRAELGGAQLELAVVRVGLARAGRRVVGHEQLDERPARR